MKKVIIGLLFMGFTIQSFAQDVLFKAKIKKEEVPEIVVASVEKDFPGYITEEYEAVPVEYIEDDVIVDRVKKPTKNYNTYQIRMKNNNENLVATYTREGELKSVVETGSNVVIPRSVDLAVLRAFPGWAMKGNSYRMVHYADKMKKERYMIIIQKGNEYKKVLVDASGNILKIHKKIKL